ncbi:hypothetical protein DFJ74DRAFT_458842 [Hyaloraphidium curvatum]|nr:hypothetical protein DFJ74DRAFT_458842 [Hyaloraphidium curvatum]
METSGSDAEDAPRKEFPCAECPRSFGRVYELRRHVRSAHGSAVFECGECGTRFSRQDALHRHRKRAATKPCGGPRRRVGEEDDDDDEPRGSPARASPAPRRPRPRRPPSPDEPSPASTASSNHVAHGTHVAPHAPALAGLPHPALAHPYAPPIPQLQPSLADPDPLLRPYPVVPSAGATPQSLMLPVDVVLCLIDQHAEFNGPYLNFHHIPTLKKRVLDGAANPTELLAVLWSALAVSDRPADPSALKGPWPRVLGDDFRRTVVRDCLEGIRTDYDALVGDARAADSADMRAAVRLAARATVLLKAAVTARMLVFAELSTLPPDTMHRMDRLVEDLFPLARFAELPYDADDSHRGMRDLAAWIWSEERSRLLGTILLVDASASDTWRPSRPQFPPGTVRFDEATGRYRPAWANLSLPCSDPLVDSLPAAPSTAREVEEWLRRDAAQGGILAAAELRPHGEAHTWMDHPRGSRRRAELLRAHGGGLLRRGYASHLAMQADAYARFVAVKGAFAVRGWKLSDPPRGSSPDEAGAREARQRIVEGLEDYLGSFPEDVRAAVEASDGQVLKTEAARWWGKSRRRLLWVPCRMRRPLCPFLIPAACRRAHGIAYVQTFRLVLHSPYDILEPRGHPIPDDDWPFSQSFIVAESAAISVSRLIRTYLDPQFTPFVDTPAQSPPWARWSGSDSGSGTIERPATPARSPPQRGTLTEEDWAKACHVARSPPRIRADPRPRTSTSATNSGASPPSGPSSSCAHAGST